MSTNNVIPVDKARLKVFKAMPPATQEIAKKYEGKMSQAATGLIILQYGLGTEVKAAMEDEGTYGSSAVEQLAVYLGVKGGATYLYALKNFSETFDKDYVKQKSAITLANGDPMTIGHWLHLMKLSEDKAREKMLDRIYKESMSSNDLAKEIQAGAAGSTKNARQGGRKPKTPSNLMVGLQGLFALSNKFVRFEEVAEKAVFDAIDEIEPDRVTDAMIEKAKLTIGQLDAMLEKAGAAKERLESGLERMEEVMVKKGEKDAETAAEEYDEGDAEKPKKKKNKGKDKPKVKSKAESPDGDDDDDDDGEEQPKKKKKKKKVAAE
jgi:hypothetical protein